jgi:hypothetical protein
MCRSATGENLSTLSRFCARTQGSGHWRYGVMTNIAKSHRSMAYLSGSICRSTSHLRKEHGFPSHSRLRNCFTSVRHRVYGTAA